MVPRKSVAQPTQKTVDIDGAGVANQAADFQVRAFSMVRVNNLIPGTFVLISNTLYSGSQPPTSTAGMDAYYSATAGSSGVVNIQVPSAKTYQMACWVPTVVNNRSVFARKGGSTGSTSLIPATLFTPNATVSNFACPQ